MNLLPSEIKGKRKIAICMYGHPGYNLHGSVRAKNLIENNLHNNVRDESNLCNRDPILGYNNLKRLLMDKYDTDIFIHSWGKKYQYQINSIYSPTKFLFEDQINFDTNLINYNIEENNKNINSWKISDNAKYCYNKDLNNNNKIKKDGWDYFISEYKIMAFRSSSRWYSTKKVLELKNIYENDNNFKYDIVILCRFDNDKPGCNISYNLLDKIDFNTIDNNYIYAEYRKGRSDCNYAMNDLWFFANSDNINMFMTLYDNRFNYCIDNPYSCREHINKFNINLLKFINKD